MTLLVKQAKKIKKVGQANEPQDSILAHISPEEASLLKKRGGSGELDPVTGLPHFKQEKGGGDPGDNDNDGKGSDKSSGGSGGRDASTSSKSKGSDSDSDSDYSSSSLGQLAAESRKGVSSTPSIGTPGDYEGSSLGQLSRARQAAAADEANESRLLRREMMARAASLYAQESDEAAEKARQEAEAQTTWGIKDAVTGLLSPVAGVLSATSKLARQKAAGQMAYNKSLEAAGLEDPGKSLSPTRDTGSRDRDTATAAKAPVQDESEKTTETATPAWDAFVAKARKKKGYASTILAGNVSAAVPQGKTLLGS